MTLEDIRDDMHRATSEGSPTVPATAVSKWADAITALIREDSPCMCQACVAKRTLEDRQ